MPVPVSVPARSTSSGGGSWFSSIQNVYTAFQARRDTLGLSNPGTVDGMSKEVQRDVFLTNSMFTGMRADITKVFSASPMFQTSHAFSIGSQGLPPYTFLSSYGTPKVRHRINPIHLPQSSSLPLSPFLPTYR